MPASRSTVAELERLRAELARRSHANDPVAFAVSLGIKPDPWQARVLTATTRRLLLNCCRQAGKSTTTAILALHRALYTTGALVLIVSPSQRQSRELLRKITQLLPRLAVHPTVDVENTQTVEFANGSRIVSLPSSEDTIRGFSAVTLLIIDEAGDVSDDLYKAVRPMLIVSGGQLIILGTPKGRRGFYFKAWERDPSAAWERIEITAADCPRISPELLEEERVALGAQFAAEYMCAFVNTAEGLVYGGFDEKRNLVPSLPFEDRPVEWTYVLGIDFGIVSATALTVLAYRDHDPVVYVAESSKRPMSPDEVALEVIELEKRFPFSRIVGDEGGQGKGQAEHMRQRFGIPVVPAQKTQKQATISLLNGDLRRGRVQVVRPTCGPLVEELTTLAWSVTKEGITKEAAGMPNHCCDSFLYGWRACTAYGHRPIETLPTDPAARLRRELDEFWRQDSLIQRAVRDREWWDDGNQYPNLDE